jgi:hypothetical protein
MNCKFNFLRITLCLTYLHHSCDTVNKTGTNDLDIIFPTLATYPADLILPDSIAPIMLSDGAFDDKVNRGGKTFIHTFITVLNTHPRFFLIWRKSPPLGQGLIHEVSRAHSMTQHSR